MDANELHEQRGGRDSPSTPGSDWDFEAELELLDLEGRELPTTTAAEATNPTPPNPELAAIAQSWEHRTVAARVRDGAPLDTADEQTGEQALHVCASRGNVPGIRALLKLGAPLEARTHSGLTPLMAAAQSNQLAAVVALLAAGANVGAEVEGATALLLACQQPGDSARDVAEVLLMGGADARHCDAPTGCSCLHEAAMVGSPATVRMLLAAGAGGDACLGRGDSKHGMTPLAWACDRGHASTALALVRAGAPLEARDVDGDTPLTLAARGGHCGILGMLLAAGADINAAWDEDGYTALHSAALRGHLGAVQMLLEAGAEVDCGTIPNRLTPLFLAAKEGQLDVVLALLRAGAAPDAAHKESGLTVLHRAAVEGQKEAAVAVLRHGGLRLLGLRDGSGRTAVEVATAEARRALQAMAEQLEREAEEARREGTEPVPPPRRSGPAAFLTPDLQDDVDAARPGNRRGGFSLTATLLEDIDIMTTAEAAECLMVAAAEGDLEAVEILLEYHNNAALNVSEFPELSTFFRGKTALIAASEGGHTQVVRLLLAHGGDAAAVDAAGDTAVHAALRGGHVDAALALLEEGACLEAKGAGGRTPMDVAPPQVREAVQARRGHDKAAAAALRQAEADQLFEEQQAEEAAGVYMHVAQLHAELGNSDLQYRCLLRAAQCSLELGEAAECQEACTVLLKGGMVPPDKEWRTLLLRSWAYQAQGQPDAAAVDLQRAEALALPSALQAAQAEAAARSVAAVAHSLGRCCSYGRRHCILCMHQPPRWALVPCGHVLLCDECHSNSVGRLKGECPADRKPFTSTLRIYL